MNRLPPPENYWIACERVRCLEALFDASVTSAGRTTEHNLGVGGHEWSKHQVCYGCNGWDLEPDDPSLRDDLADAASRLGFWVEPEEDHVHLQALPPGRGSPAPVVPT